VRSHALRTGHPDVTKYHVHKNMLGAGSQQSEYFKSVFRGGGASMREGDCQTTELELEPSAAEAFPIFLDFAYTGELEVTTESAAPPPRPLCSTSPATCAAAACTARSPSSCNTI
jgi:hypothetical protein